MFLRWTRHCLAGHCVAARCSWQLAAACPYGATSDLDVRGPASAAVGRASGTAAAWAAARLGARWIRTAVPLAYRALRCALHDASRDGLDRDERGISSLACSGGI